MRYAAKMPYWEIPHSDFFQYYHTTYYCYWVCIRIKGKYVLQMLFRKFHNFTNRWRHHPNMAIGLVVEQEVETANITVIWYKRDVMRLGIIHVVAFLELAVLKSNEFPFSEDSPKLVGLLHPIYSSPRFRR